MVSPAQQFASRCLHPASRSRSPAAHVARPVASATLSAPDPSRSSDHVILERPHPNRVTKASTTTTTNQPASNQFPRGRSRCNLSGKSQQPERSIRSRPPVARTNARNSDCDAGSRSHSEDAGTATGPNGNVHPPARTTPFMTSPGLTAIRVRKCPGTIFSHFPSTTSPRPSEPRITGGVFAMRSACSCT